MEIICAEGKINGNAGREGCLTDFLAERRS
jgi:hypothetical protein